MIIIPAIDLINKKCVRLYKGEFSSSEVVGENPLEVAKKFEAEGAKYIHIVDLDGARGFNNKNIGIIEKIVEEVKIPIEFGGGIRDIDSIDLLIEKGVSRVILGTAALNNKELLLKAVDKYGEKIAVGIDAKDEYVAVNGWTKVSKIHYIDFAKEIEEIGVETIIFTDISRDGTLKGPNLNQLMNLKESVNCNIVASGGIKNMKDLKHLKEMDLYGAITGKAVYSGNIDLKEAVKL